MPTPPKKPRASNAKVTSRRTRIAAAAVAGTPVAETAAAESLARETVSRERSAPETRLEIARLLDRQFDQVSALVPRSLDAIADALGANAYQAHKFTKTTATVDKDGAKQVTKSDEISIVEIGPDHYARLTAAKRMIELLLAGRPAPKDSGSTSPQGICTLDQIRIAVAQLNRSQ